MLTSGAAVRAQDWLGLGRVEPLALWALFLAFACAVLQVRPAVRVGAGTRECGMVRLGCSYTLSARTWGPTSPSHARLVDSLSCQGLISRRKGA